ncbi:MAG TPA: ABC transporter substrate binding protein [bacterium]|nr:ABC transporter substrate binding protein [bacterium]HPN30619.1 ABC transporter substrate binding protein [bacterium]
MKKKYAAIFFLFLISDIFIFDLGLNAQNEIVIPVLLWKKSVIYDEIIKGMEYSSNISPQEPKIIFKYFNLRENSKEALKTFNSLNNGANKLIVLLGTGLSSAVLLSDNFNPVSNLIIAGVSDIKFYPEINKNLKKFDDKILVLSYFQSITEKIKTFENLFFKPERIGVLYNPENEASDVEIPDIRNYCRLNNLILKEYVIKDKENAESFRKRLNDYSNSIKDVDLLITVSNTEITLNIDSLITKKFSIPVLSYQKEAVYKKALLSLWQNQFYTGTLIYKYISDINAGISEFVYLENLYPNRFKIYFNVSELSKLNLKIPLKYINFVEGIK